jgi:hypothetical protein
MAKEPNDDPTYGEAAMVAGARAMRQIYVALIAEGFTSAEALELVKSMLPKGGK